MIMRDILILVIGGVTRVDSVHILHNGVRPCPQLKRRLSRGQGSIGIDRLCDMQIDKGALAEYLAKALSPSERHRDRNKRLAVVNRISEGGYLKGPLAAYPTYCAQECLDTSGKHNYPKYCRAKYYLQSALHHQLRATWL